MRMATREAYAMLKAQGIPILPEGDDRYYTPGINGAVMQFLAADVDGEPSRSDVYLCALSGFIITIR